MKKKGIKYRYNGSGLFTKAEENKGYKVMASASELAKMNDERRLSSPDNRVMPKKGRKLHNG